MYYSVPRAHHPNAAHQLTPELHLHWSNISYKIVEDTRALINILKTFTSTWIIHVNLNLKMSECSSHGIVFFCFVHWHCSCLYLQFSMAWYLTWVCMVSAVLTSRLAVMKAAELGARRWTPVEPANRTPVSRLPLPELSQIDTLPSPTIILS